MTLTADQQIDAIRIGRRIATLLNGSDDDARKYGESYVEPMLTDVRERLTAPGSVLRSDGQHKLVEQD